MTAYDALFNEAIATLDAKEARLHASAAAFVEPTPVHGVTLALVSDTHGMHAGVVVPRADILIVAGDFTEQSVGVESFNQWLGEQKQCTYRVCVPGNHDDRASEHLLTKAIYLDGRTITLCGLKIYGGFRDEHAPQDVDVLITHLPPTTRGTRARIHVFGHVHASYQSATIQIKCCFCDLSRRVAEPRQCFRNESRNTARFQ